MGRAEARKGLEDTVTPHHAPRPWFMHAVCPGCLVPQAAEDFSRAEPRWGQELRSAVCVLCVCPSLSHGNVAATHV